MSMFCYQCQETAKGTGCTIKGVCGKSDDVARLQDLEIYLIKGLCEVTTKLREKGVSNQEVNKFIAFSLFTTITNANFSKPDFIERVKQTITYREALKKEAIKLGINLSTLTDAALWSGDSYEDMDRKASTVGILETKDEDVRSLEQLIIYGLKGMAAYAKHAFRLDYESEEIFAYMQKTLAALTNPNLTVPELIPMTLETGKYGVDVMALLDKANTTTYGNPEITKVNLGVRNNPAILVSGHDLKDLEELLIQTEGTGVDVYTHSEMLPAHYYPKFKKFSNLVGNYGNAWWLQTTEFESFNGPILMTTNCLVPPKDSYKNRVYTTGPVGFEGLKHIDEPKKGEKKRF